MVQAGHLLVRYADDFVMLCRSREEAEEILEDAEAALERIGLRLNRSKTGIVGFDEGFEFLAIPSGEIRRRWETIRTPAFACPHSRVRCTNCKGGVSANPLYGFERFILQNGQTGSF